MNATPVADAPASDFSRFLRHCARFRSILPKAYPRGVFKFKSLPEAQAARARNSPERAPTEGTPKPDPNTADDERYRPPRALLVDRFERIDRRRRFVVTFDSLRYRL
jgi:hypothetical protein